MELLVYKKSMQEDIDSFYIECFAAIGWEYEPESVHSDLASIPDSYQKHGQFWCLFDQGKLVGTIAIRTIDFENNYAEIKRMYVLPSRQGEGFGRALMDIAINYARQEKFNKVFADTRLDRKIAQRVLRKNGFVETERYNDNPNAELFFVLSLA
ncbi:MAG: GNAT family N-acetyltransferase [Eubacteriaceae bacterium]|nr:GNAT family N-acetyltransferase [Eubacteriaceae bacterium]